MQRPNSPNSSSAQKHPALARLLWRKRYGSVSRSRRYAPSGATSSWGSALQRCIARKQSGSATPVASRKANTAAPTADPYFFICCLLPEGENASLQRPNASPRGRLASRSQRAVRTLSKKWYGANARWTRVVSNSRSRRAGRAGDAGRPFGGSRAGFRADLVAGGTGSRDRAEPDVVLDAATCIVRSVDLPNALVRRDC